MKRGSTYSKPMAAAAAVALIATGAMFGMHAEYEATLLERRHHAESAERGLRNRIGAMSAYGDENVEALRREVGALRTHLGTEGTWDGLVRQLGGAWSVERGPREDMGTYCVERGTLTLVSHSVGEWPRIVDVAGQLEAMAGVGIANLEMKTSGTGGVRSLDTARLDLVVHTRRAATLSEIPQ